MGSNISFPLFVICLIIILRRPRTHQSSTHEITYSSQPLQAKARPVVKHTRPRRSTNADPSGFIPESIWEQYKDIQTYSSQLKDLADKASGFFGECGNTGSSREALDELEGVLDDALDTLNEMENILTCMEEGVDELKGMVEEIMDDVDEMEDIEM